MNRYKVVYHGARLEQLTEIVEASNFKVEGNYHVFYKEMGAMVSPKTVASFHSVISVTQLPEGTSS